MRFLAVSFVLMAVFAAAVPARAQYGDGHIVNGDSLKLDQPEIDTTDVPLDSLTPGNDSLFFQAIDSAQDDGSTPELEPFFRQRGGFYGGMTFEASALDPRTLDPALDGTPMMLGLQGYALFNSWLLGGAGTSATLYGMSSNYDRFSLGYAGLLVGYDIRMFHGALSVQTGALLGAGSLEMIRIREDLGGTSGHEILERVRAEDFFCVRPGLALGYAPTNFLQFSLGANYLYTIGGSSVADLRHMTYGLHITVGFID